MRFMDDIEFFASTQTEAEDILVAWQSLLSSYELMVNPTKTRITEQPSTLELPWRTTLMQFRFREGSDQVVANDLVSFFSTAFELAKFHRLDSVLSYAVSVASRQAVGPTSWLTLQNLLMAAASIDPSCLRHVAAAFSKSLVAGVPLQRLRIAENMNDLCEYHAKREHGSEVTWALWILRHFGLMVTEAAAASVSGMQDNCALLLLFDLVATKKYEGPMPDMTQAVARAEAVDAWRSEDWLLAYECARNGWASDVAMQAQAHWAELLLHGVEFFRASIPSGLPTPPVTVPPATATLTPPVTVPPATATPTPPVTVPPATATPTEAEGDDDEPWWLALIPPDAAESYPGA